MPYWMYIGNNQDNAEKYLHRGYQVARTRTGTYKVWMPGARKKRRTKYKKSDKDILRDKLRIYLDKNLNKNNELFLLISKLLKSKELFEALSFYFQIKRLLLKFYKEKKLNCDVKLKIGILVKEYIEDRFSISPLDLLIYKLKVKSQVLLCP